MAAGRLESDAIREALRDLPGWTLAEGALVRTYRTGGWRATLMVVNAIGWACETGFHHPDLDVHYGEVTVRLSTHSAGGVTVKDLAMARRIESIVGWTPGDDDPLDAPPDPLLKAD